MADEDLQNREVAGDLGDVPVRRVGDPTYEPTYKAASKWRDTSLLTSASLFDPERMAWTSDVVSDFRRRLVEQYDDSARSFSEKLADQLAGASQEVHLLAAEILYIHLLALSNVSVEKKLENINGVGALAPEPFEVPKQFVEPLGLGLINGGAGFNTNRYYLVEFLIEFAAHWSDLSEEDRSRLLEDPWAFKAMLVELPQRRANAQRNAVLFLLFPGNFEDISSNDHKKRIIAGFQEVAGDSPDLDRQLLAVRGALSERFGPEFSWYSNEVRPLWDVAKSPPAARTGPTSLSEDIEAVFPLADDRLGFLSAMAEAITAADQVNAYSWSVSRRDNGISLNVGPNRALSASGAGVGFFATGSESELVDALAEAGANAEVLPPYSFPEDAHYIKVNLPSGFGTAKAALSDRFTAAVKATASRNTPFHKSFSEEAVVHVEEALGVELPRPPAQAQATMEGARAWIVRVKRDDGTGAAEALEEAKTKVFWDIDVPAGSSIDDVRSALRASDPDLSNNAVGTSAGNLHRFTTRMQPGDLVVMPDKSDIYFGTIVGDAVFDPAAVEWSRDVEWANGDAPVDRADVSPALYSRLRTLLTVTEISELADELRSFVDSDEVQPLVHPEAQLRAIDIDTARTWMLDREWLQEIVDMLSSKKQVIFYGPPGTGKTYLATKLATQLTANGGSYQMVQFHPSYTYEDFVEGFRPRVTDGNMTYELSPGPVKDLAEAARQNPDDPYFLIIDEINRGNLAKIFGELYYLLEYRDESLILQYGNTSDDEFSLPQNLFLIGTMNTADRSIAMVDAAIRRRFYFIEFSPTEKPISGLLREWLKRERLDDGVAELLEELNRRLDDSDYSIGPSYLMTERVDQQRELERIWKHAIMPLLTEHFYGQPGTADRFELIALQRAVETSRSARQPAGALADGDALGDDAPS
ncbi:McrB family protein [Ilumatobacter nonamiensis]|uniref:McrB family protein n=1 Tax=Ilumatobacter nonamiensis TaxID=467093 RepID=UPI00034A5234|nr:AAA family ATPase [Ilumatobacter nonamiensis]